MEISEEWIAELMCVVRVKSENAKIEIKGLVEACEMEMAIAGAYVSKVDALVKQAVKLYCKANYGYDADSEKFQAAYASLRDSMALSGDYKKEGGADG